MKKTGFWILLIVLLAAAAVAALLLYPNLQGDGAMVRIRQDQEELYLLPLDEDNSVTIHSPSGGYNVVVIENSLVRMEQADCPDQTCVRHAPTDQTNDPIVCLPHRLEVSVLGGGNPALDGVVQ